jgi:type IV pilus assembly protein PilW
MTPRAAKLRRAPLRSGVLSAQAGFSLIELMIVILISMILLLGLTSVLMGTKQTFTAQNQLAQLQDNERMAMTLMTSVIQTGGYFPTQATNTPAQALPASGNFAVGQSIYGVAGDQIYVRYVAGTNDNVMDCTGQTNTGASPVTDVNTLYVANNQLVCQVTVNGVAGTPVGLVNGVTGMTILYGVDTNNDLSTDQYLTASQMTAAAWNTVTSVQITLTFANPLTGTGTGTSATTTGVLTLTRTIDLMNKT